MAQVSPTLLHTMKKSFNISDTHKSIKNELTQYATIIEKHSPLTEVDANTMIDNLQSMNETLYNEVYTTKVDSDNSEDLLLEVRNTLNKFFATNTLGDAGLPITDLDV